MVKRKREIRKRRVDKGNYLVPLKKYWFLLLMIVLVTSVFAWALISGQEKKSPITRGFYEGEKFFNEEPYVRYGIWDLTEKQRNGLGTLVGVIPSVEDTLTFKEAIIFCEGLARNKEYNITILYRNPFKFQGYSYPTLFPYNFTLTIWSNFFTNGSYILFLAGQLLPNQMWVSFCYHSTVNITGEMYIHMLVKQATPPFYTNRWWITVDQLLIEEV